MTRACTVPPPLEPIRIPNPRVVSRYANRKEIYACNLWPDEVFDLEADYRVELEYPVPDSMIFSRTMKERYFFNTTLDEVLEAAEWEAVYSATVYRFGELSPLCFFWCEELDDDIAWYWE